jgi:archaellin
MKNIHILPTDKPSRLYLNSENKIFITDVEMKCGNTQHIYITSDEEIKFNEYVIQVNFEKTNTQVIRCTTEFQVKIANDEDGSFTKKKIILTTDQDLIKDGVQAIDDEFLEWYIKNPSCENVKVELIEEIPSGFTFGMFGNDEPPTELVYKIIIPQENQ